MSTGSTQITKTPHHGSINVPGIFKYRACDKYSKTEDIFLQCKASCNMQLTNKPPLQITRSILMPHEKFRACISLCITSLRSTALQSSSTFMSNRCKISCVLQYSGAQLLMRDSIKVCLYHTSQISSHVDTINLVHFKACDG